MLRIPFALLAALAFAPLAPALDATRVLLVYRADCWLDGDGDGVQDSLEVALYYAAKRGVPAANLLALDCPVGRDQGYWDDHYHDFYAEIALPICARLDALGTSNIDVILFSYDLPMGLGYADRSIDNAMMVPYLWGDNALNPRISGNPYFEASPGFADDRAHFSHLTYNLGSAGNMYLVSRLDGPRGVQGALDLIDQSLYGDRYIGTGPGQLGGCGYIDSKGVGGLRTDAALAADPRVQRGDYSDYDPVDVNIAYGEHWVAPSGLALKWESGDSTIGDPGLLYQDGSDASSAPRALAYGGWYNFNHYKNVFDWLPGSVACDLNSASLNWYRIRDPNGSTWGGRALGAGATYVCGVSEEPYTTGHTRPNVLLAYMLRGYQFGEAAALANPLTAWMSFALGDPLGAPFAPKPLIADTTAPRLARPPQIGGDPAQGATLDLLIDDAAGPEVANVRVDYGPTTAYGASFTSGFGYFRRHHLGLPPASASTHVRLTLTDPVGNAATTADFTLAGGPDVTPPRFANTNAGWVTATSAVVAWGTDEAADTRVDYGTSTAYGSQSGDGALTTDHSRTLTGLTAGTTYHYRVASRDAAGNLSESGDATFVTAFAANLPPMAHAGATPGDGAASLTVAFSASGSSDPDGSIVAYDWSFGDGASASGAVVAHVYASVGSYTATLTVRDDAGATGTAACTITVTGSSSGSGLRNAGFESPPVGQNSWGAFAYAPAGAGWTFTSASGVSGNGSGFTAGNPAAPEGTQVGVLQMTSAISQSMEFQAGTYVVAFEAAQRVVYQTSSQDFEVLIDGARVGLVRPTDAAYRTYRSDPFTVATGAHEIRFHGLDSDGGDNTAFLDAVRVDAAAPPATSTVRLAVDNRYDQLAINGAGVAVGPHDGDWSTTDAFAVAGDVRCVALRAINDEPGSNWAGLLATIRQGSGKAVASDASWRIYVPSDGQSPPNDGFGRVWSDPAYDDSGWTVATSQGAYGVGPWYTHDGSAGMDGAEWIWAGDPAFGVSPIYVRWADVPRGIGMGGPRGVTRSSP